MSLPEIERRTVAKLATDWEISPSDLEDFLETGKLIASIKLPLTMLYMMDLEAEYDEWGFRTKSATDSDRTRPPNTIEVGHLFRLISATP